MPTDLEHQWGKTASPININCSVRGKSRGGLITVFECEVLPGNWGSLINAMFQFNDQFKYYDSDYPAILEEITGNRVPVTFKGINRSPHEYNVATANGKISFYTFIHILAPDVPADSLIQALAQLCKSFGVTFRK